MADARGRNGRRREPAHTAGPGSCRHRGGWTCLPRVATGTLGADAGSLRAARDFTVATLRRWHVAHRGDEIVIVVPELLTNALRHALPEAGQTWPRRPIRLGLLQRGACVVCAVAGPFGQALSLTR